VFTYKSSVVLERVLGSQWKPAQLGDMTVHNIFNTFRQTVHIVTHPDYETDLYVDFNALRETHGSSDSTLLQWLIDNDNQTLPLLEELPASRIRYVSYSDAIQAGYKVMAGSCSRHYPSNYPDGALPDLIVTRPKTSTDVSELHSKSMITVNGYLHLTDTDGENLWVIDGGRTMSHSNLNHMGIISFNDVCSMEKFHISNEMIYPEINGRPLREHMVIKLPEDINHRVVVMSIGGYIQFIEPSVMWQSGADMISICIDRLPFLKRFHESNRYLDLSGMGLSYDPNNPTAVSVDELFSDQVLKNYMGLTQTFVMLLDIENLFYRQVYIRESNLPGMYVSHVDPRFPQITGYGKFSEYWKVFEDNQWAINIRDGHTDNYVSDYRPMQELDTVNAHRVPGRTYWNSTGHLLEIGGY